MAMAIATVAAVGAVAPAMASADVWDVGGTPYSGPAQLVGTLTTTLTANGAKTTCDVRAGVDLDNGAPGGVARGELRSYLTGSAAGGACTTTFPGCSVALSPDTSPAWTIATAGSGVTISGVSYQSVYSGSSCPFAGVPFSTSGSMTGSVAAATNSLEFSSSPGLTFTLGPVTVSGSLEAYVEDSSGDADLTQPITLEP